MAEQGPGVPGPGPGLGYGAPRTEPLAIWALVLAIASWAFCPVLPAIVALPLAGSAQQRIAASGGWLTGAGLVTAARVVAWTNLGLAIGVVVFLALVALVAGLAAATGG